MLCEEFRFAVGAEPMATRTDIAEHAATCAQCAVYRLRLQALDRAILTTLHSGAGVFGRSVRPWLRVAWPAWNLAAGVLLAVSIAGLWLSGTRPSFAAELIAHARHEPASLVDTLDVVPAGELANLLEREGLRLRPAVLRVSYASGCRFRGHFAPHLVVQADHGPVALLLLPHEQQRATIERIHASGFDAVILPAPRGVLVAVGHGAGVQSVAQAALSALDYEVRL